MLGILTFIYLSLYTSILIHVTKTELTLVCRWVFFPQSDLPYLYPQCPNSMDPVFEADIRNPNLENQPLLHLTHPSECILSEGLYSTQVNSLQNCYYFLS